MLYEIARENYQREYKMSILQINMLQMYMLN